MNFEIYKKNSQNLQRRDLFDIIFCLHDWYIHLEVVISNRGKKESMVPFANI
jgi:hypothetical protein